MKHIQKLKEVVKELLYKSHWNRNSDYALYADYIKEMLPDEPPNKYYEIMSHCDAYEIGRASCRERVCQYV